MITITVKLENEYDSTYEMVEITKEELLQLACNKAKEQYTEGTWTKSTAAEVEVKTTV